MFRKMALIFASTLAVLWIIFYCMVTVAPIFACLVGIMYAACAGGNVTLFWVSGLLTLTFIAILSTPFIYDYLETKKKIAALEDKLASFEDRK